MRALGELIRYCADYYGDKAALICKDRTLSFLDLNELSDKLGTRLAELGIGYGDRVSIYSHNCWEWIVSYYAILKIGAVVNPINAMLTSREVLAIVNDCEAKLILVSLDNAEAALNVAHQAVTVNHVVIYGDEAPKTAIAFNRLLKPRYKHLTILRPDLSDVSTIAYTAGTIGQPKGAMLTHRSVLLSCKFTARMHAKTPSDIVVSGLPMVHVYGMVVMNSTFLTGGTLVLLEKFNEQAAFNAITKYKATMFEGMPYMYSMLLAYPGIDRYSLSSLKRCTIGGQKISVSMQREAERRFGCPLLGLWSMTEISGAGATQPFMSDKRLGSIGVPLPCCKVKIVDLADPTRTLGSGHAGELMIKGPIVMRGYYNNEEETKKIIEADGWLHTRDIATMKKDGHLYIIDRCDDIIQTGGFNIYPAEIDQVLSEHPAVAMGVVGAIPNEVMGELPKAYVVLKPGMTATEDEIKSFCLQRLATYKVPRLVQFVAELPRTSTGKILRRALKELDATDGVRHVSEVSACSM